MNKNIWQGRKVLLTGHTGFKGSWLALWLTKMGAEVTGLALDPYTELNHWELLGLDIPEYRVDLRERDMVAEIIKKVEPDVVFHLAAQALVQKSYRDPVDTWSTNVMGAVNLLDACRLVPSIKSIIVITSDKCYENVEWDWGYRESDTLGGIDPYSASKAAVELVTSSYKRSFFEQNGTLVATTRAGNVIGGGDWSDNRLIPDIVKSTVKGEVIKIRSPNATRPWQHVLEPISGYILLAEQLILGNKECATSWNFGPDDAANQTVEVMLNTMQKFWPAIHWELDGIPMPHEATLLNLDSTKARRHLNWQPVWDLDDTLQATAEWFRSHYEQKQLITLQQWEKYQSDAQAKGLEWAKDLSLEKKVA